MSDFSFTIRLLALAASAALVPAAALAATAQAKGPAAQRAETLRTPQQALQAYRQAAARRPANAGTENTPDITAPTVQRFEITGDVAARSAQPMALANVSFADDMSGISSYTITLVGPSGQWVMRSQPVITGQLSLEGTLAVGAAAHAAVPFSRYTEPGTWSVESVMVSDNAYNLVYLDRAQVAALGRSSFEVVNPGPYDAVAPSLRSGTIETPSVSVSTPPAGAWTGVMPYVSAVVQVADTGNGVASGVEEVMLGFCLRNQYNDCVDGIEMLGRADAPGSRQATVRIGQQLRSDQTPGEYTLYRAYVMDTAKNLKSYYAKDMGGDTNFRRYFGNIVINVRE